MSIPAPSPPDSTHSPKSSRGWRIARARAICQTTLLQNRWIPPSIRAGLTQKQIEFLCFEGREALFGGAAGGGKSIALLAAALQYVDEPGYSALILRRTFKQLAKADSILSKAKEWLLGKVRYNGDEKKFTFPSGATLEFGHMEHEDAKLNYQGGSWAYVGVDEATQFTESMLAYPRSRQRRPAGSRIPMRWRGASNPGGIGHDAVKGRYVKAPDGSNPATSDRQFFPATLDDNPHIDRDDYVRQLRESGIDPLTLAQLLRGDWDAIAGGRFRAEWFTRRFQRRGTHYLIGDRVYEVDRVMRFGTCDPAASALETAKSADPDYTVVSAWGITPQPELLWLDCVRVRKEIPDLVPVIQSVYDRWELTYVGIEAVAANRAVLQLARRTRMNVKELSPLGQDKLVRATAAMVLAESRRVYLPEHGTWIEDALAEVTRFTGNDKQDAHDDVVDTLSYAAKLFTVNEQQKAGGFAPYFSGGRR